MTRRPHEIRRIYPATPARDGAGVRLKRSIGTAELDHLDPFLMLDQFDTENADDYIADFPDHPHRGFETVTYMIAGQMRHADNTGAGGVQWMTAGCGIVHSEMPEQQDGQMKGFQIWINLPARDKMSPPRYQNIEPEDVPEGKHGDGVTVRIIAGQFDGAVGEIAGKPIYLDAALPAGAAVEFGVPAGYAGFIYPFKGAVEIVWEVGSDPVTLADSHLGELGDGDVLTVRGGADGGRFILVAGQPINEPIARHGPFVMNTRAEIIQAVRDFQEGKF